MWKATLINFIVALPLLAQPAQQPAADDMKQLSQGVSHVLADTFVLYTTTLNFHWNVVGPRFQMLHEFFGAQYEALAEAVDDIAEQVRTLGFYPPSTLKEFLDLTQLQEPSGHPPADQMIKKLLQDNEAIVAELRPLIQQATAIGEDGCADLLIERMRYHQKIAWMLRSHLAT